ncbi:MAG: SMP-30/gluconolactonase/LRE family protein [Gilvibacter sp.]
MKPLFKARLFFVIIFFSVGISLFESCSKATPIAQLEYKIAAQLGEGALWNHKTNEFYWVDIEGKTFYVYNPQTKENRSYPLPSRVGTVVPYTETEAVLALEDGIYTIDLNTKALNRISDVEATMTQNRFNDGKCDPAGNLWVGSMHLEQSAPEANLYKVNTNGEATQMLDNITISNGIVWTKDAATMYYIDTPTGQIQAFDYDKKTATITNGRVAITVPESLGYPDGMTIDDNDKLWVGLWNGNAVAQFDPLDGSLLQKIEVPAHNVTAAAFGGPDLETLYITTASVDMTPEEKEQYPLAGSIFMVKVSGVKGVNANFFGQ